MTVSTQLTKRIYQGNGVTTAWEVDFPLLSAADLSVYVTSPHGVEEKVTQGYALDMLTHTLTYPTAESCLAPLSDGTTLTLVRNTPLTQEIDLLRQGELDAEVLEQGYDKLTLLVQELSEKLSRSIKYPVSMPESSDEANAFLTKILSARRDALSASTKAAASAQVAQTSAAEATQTATQAQVDIAAASAAAEARLAQQGGQILSSAQTAAATATAQAATAQAYAEHSIGKSLGEVYVSQSSVAADNPGSLCLWTGEYYANASTLYPDFYAWVKSRPELCTTKATYDAAISAAGACPYYVADEVEGSLRLPKLSVYTKTNQSVTVTLYPWVVAYNSAVPPSTAQAAAFNGALSGKAAADLSNVSRLAQAAADNLLPQAMDYVVESKLPTEEDSSWYRRYKSGWLEQGGISVGDTVSYPVAFASAVYGLILTGHFSGSYYASLVNTKTATGFTVFQGQGYVGGCEWRASGMGASV